jgi:hypothetical protein
MAFHCQLGATFSQRFAGSHGLWDGVSYFPSAGTVYWQSKRTKKKGKFYFRHPEELVRMRAFALNCADRCELHIWRRWAKAPEVVILPRHPLGSKYAPVDKA